MKYLIVGSGLSGATIARLATDDGHNVTVIDKRFHVGGNVYDQIDEKTNAIVGLYGAHIFHTNNDSVWQFVNKYSEWLPYEHRVKSKVGNHTVPVPVNINTMNTLLNMNIKTEKEASNYLDSIVYKGIINNSEHAALSRVGRELYEMMFKNYTKKQWDKYPSELEPSVLERIPVRPNFNDRYFNDKYEAMPKYGYTVFMNNLLNGINVLLNTEYNDIMKSQYDKIYFTGRIDSYFNHMFGELEYRSLRFENTYTNTQQEASVINYPETKYAWTRIIDYSHFYPDRDYSSYMLVKEYSSGTGEAYYPVPNDKNREIYKKYQIEAEKKQKEGLYFVGRLANYKYFNMDQAIENAMRVYRETK